MAPAKSPPTTTLTQNTRAPPLNWPVCCPLWLVQLYWFGTAGLRYDGSSRPAVSPAAARPLSVVAWVQEPAGASSNCGLGHAHSGGRIGQGQPKGSGPGGGGGARGHELGRHHGQRP